LSFAISLLQNGKAAAFAYGECKPSTLGIEVLRLDSNSLPYYAEFKPSTLLDRKLYD